MNQGDRNDFESQQQDIFGWEYALKNTETKYLSDRGIDIWVADIDFSGKTTERPGMDWIRAAIKAGHVRCVVSNKFDRQARNPAFDAEFGRECAKKGCYLKSVHESIPEGPVGTLLKNILAAFAEYELFIMATRMNGGRRALIKHKGVHVTGKPPYGYTLRGTRYKSGHGEMDVCPAEAEVVRLVFYLRGRGYKPHAIAGWLTRQGIPTRNGLAWDSSTISSILSREAAYRGECLFSSKVQDPDCIAHVPILPTRPVEERTGCVLDVPTLRLAQIPDDPDQPSIRLPDLQSPLNAGDQRTAMTLLAAIKMEKAGYSRREIAERLNAAHIYSPTGAEWTQGNIVNYLQPKRRPQILAAIERAGVSSVFLPVQTTTAEEQQEQNQRRRQQHEIVGAQRIRELNSEHMALKNKPMPLRRIAAVLAVEGFTTQSGAAWSFTAVARVLQGTPRHSERREASAGDPGAVEATGTVRGAVKGAVAAPTDYEREAQALVRELRKAGMRNNNEIAQHLNVHHPHPRADLGQIYTAQEVGNMDRGNLRWKDGS